MALCRSLSPLAGRMPTPQFPRLRVPANRHRPGFPLSSAEAREQPLQSQPNPLGLKTVLSVRYPRNAMRQSHCVYLSCFQQVNPEKQPLFRERIVARSEFEEWRSPPGLPKPANPLQLNPMGSVAYRLRRLHQTHCTYLACFQRLNREKWPLFGQKIAVHGVGRVQRSVELGRRSVSSSVLSSVRSRAACGIGGEKSRTTEITRSIDRRRPEASETMAYQRSWNVIQNHVHTRMHRASFSRCQFGRIASPARRWGIEKMWSERSWNVQWNQRFAPHRRFAHFLRLRRSRRLKVGESQLSLACHLPLATCHWLFDIWLDSR